MCNYARYLFVQMACVSRGLRGRFSRIISNLYATHANKFVSVAFENVRTNKFRYFLCHCILSIWIISVHANSFFQISIIVFFLFCAPIIEQLHRCISKVAQFMCLFCQALSIHWVDYYVEVIGLICLGYKLMRY